MPEHLSGTVRFSVESLLFYAPKISGTGTALAGAVHTAQRRLTDLGDFFGRSWPDEPFRNSYPRCQWAMLIIARQVANEIQGIAGGIEQMARTYGITEDQNTADAQRILANQERSAFIIHGTGGLDPPPTVSSPFASPPAAPAHPVPSPQAGPTPTPPRSPSGSRISYSSAAVPGRVAPDPRPGTDPTSWHPTDPLNLLGPWPSGDPDKMDEAAACWSTLCVALDTAWTDLQRYTDYIMADAQGPAANAFQDYVDTLTGRGHGLLFRAIDMAQELQNTCTRQATEIRAIKSDIEQTLIEIAATFVIGQVLSLLTFGTAEEATAATETVLTAKLTRLATHFAEDGTVLAGKLNATAEGLGKIGAAMIVSGSQSALIGEADLAATNVIGQAFGQKPVQGAAALKAIAEDGGIGLFFGQGSAGGLFGLSTATLSKRLIELGETLQRNEESDSRTATALITLGRQFKDTSFNSHAVNTALTQLISQHQITPLTFITGTIANRFLTAISPNTGTHVRP